MPAMPWLMDRGTYTTTVVRVPARMDISMVLVPGGLLEGKALRPVAGAALQNDDGVIHDHADGQDQARAGEDVHIVADEVQHDDGQQDGQGHTDSHHQTALPIAKEQEQDRHSQHHADQKGLENALQRDGDIVCLVVDDLVADALARIAVQGVENLAAHAHGGRTMELPKKEFGLLYKLLSYPGQIFTRSQLLDDVWGYVSESEEDTVKTHISRLRNRLKDVDDFQIITIKGLGYKAELVKEKEQ